MVNWNTADDILLKTVNLSNLKLEYLEYLQLFFWLVQFFATGIKPLLLQEQNLSAASCSRKMNVFSARKRNEETKSGLVYMHRHSMDSCLAGGRGEMPIQWRVTAFSFLKKFCYWFIFKQHNSKLRGRKRFFLSAGFAALSEEVWHSPPVLLFWHREQQSSNNTEKIISAVWLVSTPDVPTYIHISPALFLQPRVCAAATSLVNTKAI